MTSRSATMIATTTTNNDSSDGMNRSRPLVAQLPSITSPVTSVTSTARNANATPVAAMSCQTGCSGMSTSRAVLRRCRTDHDQPNSRSVTPTSVSIC